MKKTITVILAAALAVCLCACGFAAKPAQEAEPEPAELSPAVEVPASESSAADDRVPPASSSETEAEPEPEQTAAPADSKAMYELAESCVGRTAGELIAALGEPESSQYAASCETDGAEDGMLFYSGFYVWTVRTADEELVRAVYPDE